MKEIREINSYEESYYNMKVIYIGGVDETGKGPQQVQSGYLDCCI